VFADHIHGGWRGVEDAEQRGGQREIARSGFTFQNEEEKGLDAPFYKNALPPFSFVMSCSINSVASLISYFIL